MGQYLIMKNGEVTILMMVMAVKNVHKLIFQAVCWCT